MQSHGRRQHLEQNAVGGGDSTSNQPSGPRLSITTTKSPTWPQFLLDSTPCDWIQLMQQEKVKDDCVWCQKLHGLNLKGAKPKPLFFRKGCPPTNVVCHFGNGVLGFGDYHPPQRRDGWLHVSGQQPESPRITKIIFTPSPAVLVLPYTLHDSLNAQYESLHCFLFCFCCCCP